MRKILLSIALLISTLAFSQGVEIVPFTGYMFGGTVKFVEGEIDINNGQNYGISILKPIKAGIDLELNYTRMGSKMSFSPYYGYNFSSEETHVETNYFQIGVLKKLKSDTSRVIPFGSFSLGATWFDSSDLGDAWRFSVTLGAGIKIMITEKIGIIARGRLMMPMQFAGIGFTIGTGGSGVSANSYVTPLQGDFSGGLIIKLGK